MEVEYPSSRLFNRPAGNIDGSPATLPEDLASSSQFEFDRVGIGIRAVGRSPEHFQSIDTHREQRGVIDHQAEHFARIEFRQSI